VKYAQKDTQANLFFCMGIDVQARHITNVSFRVPYFAVAHNVKYAQKDTQIKSGKFVFDFSVRIVPLQTQIDKW
jgi:hypothetical protein